MNLTAIRKLLDYVWQERDVRWMIILSLFLPLFVLPGTTDPYGTSKVDLFYLLVGLVLITGLPNKLNFNFLGNIKKLFMVGLLVFLASSLVSIIYSVDFFYSLRGYDFRYIHSILFYFVWSALIIRLSVLDIKKLKWIIWTLICSVFVVAIQAYLDVLSGLRPGIFYSWINLRPVGLLGNPNFSSFFVSSLFLFFVWGEKYIVKRFKFAWLLGSLFALGSLLLFMSRGNILGAVVGLMLYFGIVLYRSNIKFSLSKTVSIVIPCLLIIFVLFQILIVRRTETFSLTSGLTEANILNRVNLYDIAIDGFKRKPFTGFGLGNYGYVYQSWVKTHGYVDTAMNDDPHNYFLNLLVTGGIGLFAGFVLMLFGGLWLLWVKSRDKENGNLFLAAFVSLIVWIINAQFNPIEISGMLVLAVLLALALSGNMEKGAGIKSAYLKVFGFSSLLIAASFIIGDTFLNLGLVAYNNQNIELANKYLKISNSISPGTRMISSLYTMTQIQIEPNSFDWAVSKYSQTHPKYGETNYWLGNFYMNKYLSTNDGKFLDQSINYFKEAALDAPFSDSSVKYYAQSLIEKGNYDEAAMVVKQWVAKKPENFDAWNVLAKVYQRQKKFSQMEWVLKQSYKADPNQEYIAKVLHQFKIRQKPEQVEYYIVNKVGRF